MTQKTDMLYGRQGGRLVAWDERDGTAKPCMVCGLPMLAGQKTRHFVCSPPMPCCGWPEDLIQDKRLHAKNHAEAQAAS